MNAHKAAAVFPMLADAELDALASDIAKNGQRDPIVLLDGEILDGRNRFAACELAGVAPSFVEADDSMRADPIAFVVSKNLHRRHMDESQRGLAAARLTEVFAVDAAARQAAGRTAGTEATKAKGTVANLPPPSETTCDVCKRFVGVIGEDGCPECGSAPVHLRKPLPSKSRDQAAALLNVSPRTVGNAKRVLDKGSPELVAAVERGDLAVSAAAEIAKLPVEQQSEAIVAPKATKTPKPDATVATVTEPSRERLRVLLKEAHAVASEIEKADNTKRASAHLPHDLVLRDIRRRIGKAQKQLADLIKVEAERLARTAVVQP